MNPLFFGGKTRPLYILLPALLLLEACGGTRYERQNQQDVLMYTSSSVAEFIEAGMKRREHSRIETDSRLGNRLNPVIDDLAALCRARKGFMEIVKNPSISTTRGGRIEGVVCPTSFRVNFSYTLTNGSFSSDNWNALVNYQVIEGEAFRNMNTTRR